MSRSAQQQEPWPDSDACIEGQRLGNQCRGTPALQVGAFPQHHIEQELDDVIRELGHKSNEAMLNGDPTGARLFSRRMYAAIASRTPEHQARLAAELEQRITDGLDYFQSPAAMALGRATRGG